MALIFLKCNQILACVMAWANTWQVQIRWWYLSVLPHRARRQRLVQHLYIRMLGKVVQPTKVTDELLQLLQKLGDKPTTREYGELDKSFKRSKAALTCGRYIFVGTKNGCLLLQLIFNSNMKLVINLTILKSYCDVEDFMRTKRRTVYIYHKAVCLAPYCALTCLLMI